KTSCMRKLIVISSCLLSLFLLISKNGCSQSLTSEDIRNQMVKEWERAKSYTVEYLNTMPANQYTFKAVDSIRSFAQQMLHLSQGNLFLMSTATDITPPSFLMYNLEGSPTAQNKDSVMYYVTSSYDYCINAVKNFDTKKWGENKKVFGMDQTRFALMIKTFEHQTHHRGQTTIYIRLRGIRPPNERLM
ncbi:MAG: DinB family protein, partial [Flavisolibacter sp.]